MTGTRDELRDHLTAVIEAARELPAPDRQYLADTFLDELETRYEVAPRGNGSGGFRGPVSRQPASALFAQLDRRVFFLIPVLVLALFVLLHPPIVLLAVVALLVLRFTRPGRRGGWRYGPRGRHTRNYIV